MTKKKIKVIDAPNEINALVKRDSTKLAEEKGEWLLDEDKSEELEKEEKNDESNESDFEHDTIFRSFARQIAKIKRLSEEEERALGKKVRANQDQDAKKKLVLHNMRLALKMAHQYRRSWTNLMDLVQEASAGMAIAAEKWDPDMGTKFGTYAAYWIRAQLTKFLMTNARLIHTANTRAGRKIYFNLPQIQRKLLAQGKNPSAELIAKEVNEDPKEVQQVLLRLQGREASLSAPIDDDQSLTLQDSIAADDMGPENLVAHREMQRIIKEVMAGFEGTIKDERDLAIWKENLISSEPLSLVELGKRYGVSKQRMGQLATRIKRSFRRYIIEQLGPTTQLSWLFRDD